MCGIAGFCNGKTDSERVINQMTDKIINRGPDSCGAWMEEDYSVVLGHRRLAILDVSPAGHQPMLSHSENYVMAYNGEIYNHKEIAERISKKGIRFKGTSDTEVLLEAFELWGIDETLAQIKGMFAIALFDRLKKCLFLIRDRAGEKPLYYGFVNGKFSFASDLACLKAIKDNSLEIDYSSTELFFRRGYIPAPYSIYKDIRKLEPGHYLKVEAPYDSIKDFTFWSAENLYRKGQDNRFKGSIEEAENILEQLLCDSIKGQMISDVPLGAFLSAGIDSSTIVALMQRQSEKPIRTFTIGVDTPEYNEAPIAAETARILGTKHTEKYVSVPELKAVIPQISKMYSEPFADSSQIPTAVISRIARQDVTVALSGDGGDELFCGYGRYNGWVIDAWNKQRALPLPIQHARGLIKGAFGSNGRSQFAKRLMSSSISETYAAVSASDTSFIKNKIEYKDYYDLFKSDGDLTQQDILMLMDFQMYLSDDILAKVDRAAMHYSLETRIPFLDKDVIEFAWSLPLEYKYQQGITKKILRNIVYKYVPKELLERPKTGFSIPLDLWLREGELREWAEGLLFSDILRNTDILDEKYIHNLWESFIENGEWSESIWYVLVYLDWLHNSINM